VLNAIVSIQLRVQEQILDARFSETYSLRESTGIRSALLTTVRVLIAFNSVTLG
jgi:hypothetical protein